MEKNCEFATKTLEFPFKRDGFTHELIKREGLVCLVKRSKPAHWHYEVIKLRIRSAEEAFGKFYPERETYPSDEEWGTNGFTFVCTDLERANECFQCLSKTAKADPVG